MLIPAVTGKGIQKMTEPKCEYCERPIPPKRKTMNGKPVKFCCRNHAQRASMLAWLTRGKKK